MLLSVLDVFSTAREASQTLKYPLKARNNGPPPKSSDDNGAATSAAAALRARMRSKVHTPLNFGRGLPRQLPFGEQITFGEGRGSEM